jgi:predicted nucleic-acid-binding Zn-ribbon protein
MVELVCDKCGYSWIAKETIGGVLKVYFQCPNCRRQIKVGSKPLVVFPFGKEVK